jgi:hypothetical protein
MTDTTRKPTATLLIQVALGFLSVFLLLRARLRIVCTRTVTEEQLGKCLSPDASFQVVWPD